MTIPSRRLLLRSATFAMASVLLLAGCKSSANNTATKGTATQPAAQAPAGSPAAQANSLQVALDLANRAASGQTTQYSGRSGKTIGFVAAQLSNEGFRAEYVGFLAKAIQANMSVVTLNAENDVTKQLNMIQDLITRKVDAIVFTPVDSAALSAGVTAANKANIPIVAIDNSTEGGQLAAVVESDNVAIGATGLDLLLQAAKNANINNNDLKILEVMGDQSTSAGVERHQGFSNEAAKMGVKIARAIDAKWDATKANAAVLDAFQAQPDINAIYMASGCAYYSGVESALKSLNKLEKIGSSKHIIWISTDGCPPAVDAIRQGYVDADSAQRLVEMGEKAADAAIAVLNKQPIAQQHQLLPADPITPSNVNDPAHWANVLRSSGSR